MTDSTDTPNIDSEEEERRSRNARNLALKIMVEKFKIWEQKQDEVMEAKNRRGDAEEAYDEARGIAYGLVKKHDITSGRLVITSGRLVMGTYIIQILHNSISIIRAEILE